LRIAIQNETGSFSNVSRETTYDIIKEKREGFTSTRAADKLSFSSNEKYHNEQISSLFRKSKNFKNPKTCAGSEVQNTNTCRKYNPS